MVYTREQAAQRAEASRTTSAVGLCQKWTRTMIGAPSAGDVDGDGDADAVDGWKSEPAKYRHPGDRRPPRGVPVSWSGGRHGYGHRAVSLGGGMIRSTDAGGACRNATVPLSWVEAHWGLHYLGWSETMDGLLIPTGEKPKPPKKEKPVPDDKTPTLKETIAAAEGNLQRTLDALTAYLDARPNNKGEAFQLRQLLRAARTDLDGLGK